MKAPIQWATGTNKGRSEAANGTRLVNLFAEAMPADSKSPVVLLGTPGTELYVDVANGPIIGMHRFDGDLYVATKSNLYRVFVYRGKPLYLDMGSVSFDRERVSMASNGDSLVIVGGAGYQYDKTNGLRELSGDGWYPATTVTYQDGYYIFNREGTGEFFLSQLLSTDFDPLDYATAEGSPDDTVAVISHNRMLWLFGQETTEVWYNSGASDFPFERVSGAFVTKGCAAPYSLTQTDEALTWLGDDGVVYQSVGYTPQRISSHAVEYDIQQGRTDDALAFTHTIEGHHFYVLILPEQGKTWAYDASTGLWAERKHYQHTRHVANCAIEFDGRTLVGAFDSGKIYTLSMDSYTDDGDVIERIAVSPTQHAGRHRATMRSFELDMETGVGLADGYGSDPQVMLRWSDDGGKTWSNEHWRSIGKLGEYSKRVKWNRLGQFRQRQLKVTITDPVRVVILGAFAEVALGRG